jgi:glycosyltransferase involved in cell wall biosynthesis
LTAPKAKPESAKPESAKPESAKTESANPETASRPPATKQVLIAHEWLTALGGSDKTVQAMVQALPGCRLLTAVADPRLVDQLLPGQAVERLWTDHLPGARESWRRYGPVIALAWSTVKLGNADILVSSSHFATKAAGLRFRGPHLCYCYTPMRVAWRPDLELHRLRPTMRPVANALLPAVRKWDRHSAQGVTAFAGISRSVVERIRHAYDRDARCIFPPVDVESFLSNPRLPGTGRYFLAFGRLIPYKRIDLAVRVCTAHDYPLVVAGSGPDEARLRALAGPSVQFLGYVDDQKYRELLADTIAVLFPGEEDFGIVPVEAQAAGCPVIALGKGGALDTVQDGETGILFPEATAADLEEGIARLLAGTWDTERIRQWTTQFSGTRFRQEFLAFLAPYLA